MRCFIALDIPENIKKEIVKIQNFIPEFNGKLTEKENLHLTLKFLGEIDEKLLGKVKEKLKEVKLRKFQASLGEIGTFAPRIVWLKLNGCDELQKEIDESLKDFFPEEERFMSHLTIARIKHIKDPKKFIENLKKVRAQALSFEVNKFSLKKSTLSKKGPVYEELVEVGLE